MDTNEVDTLLTMSDPARDLTVRERHAVAAMVTQSTPTAKTRRHLRPIAIAGITAALLGGGGIAVAATGLWNGWAEDDALAILKYELPSGVSCERRIGNVQGAPDEVDEVIRATLAGADIDDAEVAEGAAYVGASDPLTDDDAYQAGYNWAIILRIEEALTARGLDDKWASLEGQGICQ